MSQTDTSAEPGGGGQGMCAGGHPAKMLFRFSTGATGMEKCLRHAVLHPPAFRNAIATALVVGSLLTAINQGNVLLNGHFPSDLRWKIPLTYTVPYLVSTWAVLRISLIRRTDDPSGNAVGEKVRP